MIEAVDLEFAYAADSGADSGADREAGPGAGGFALRVAQLMAPQGGHLALIGPSGSGKTTLLFLLSGILAPQRGRLVVDGQDLSRLSPPQRRRFRLTRVGLVLQTLELLEHLSVRDNLLLPYRLGLKRVGGEAERAEALAHTLGLASKLNRRPSRLSHGERQRVAIGRALITDPPVLLADEPTGSLDPDNKRRVLDLLLAHAAERQTTVVMATHDHSLLDRFQSVQDVSAFHGRLG